MVAASNYMIRAKMNLTSLSAVSALVLILASGALSASLDLADGQVCSVSKWRLFKEKFSKSYDEKSGEDKIRLGIFCRNLLRILEHNANSNATYTLGLNQFSDRTSEEMSRYVGGLKLGSQEQKFTLKSLRLSTGMSELSAKDTDRLLNRSSQLGATIPNELDWASDPRRVSPARSQGDCGSCWAFTTVAMLEGQEKPESGKLVELSEQNLVDCDRIDHGCEGGMIPQALHEVKRLGGLMKLEDYPYVSGDTQVKGSCKMVPQLAFDSTVNLGRTLLLQQGDENQLKRFVANYGPVAAAIYSQQDFADYRGGVYYSRTCNGIPNHAITIVGYGTDKKSGLDYWKIKNSWSREWGQDGFGYMARNMNNHCHIATLAYIAMPNE